MKSYNYAKVHESFKKGENIERSLMEFIAHVEGQYFKFWLTNIELDYITFLEISREKETEWVLAQDELLEKLYKYIVSLLSDPKNLLNSSERGQHQRINTLKKYKLELQRRIKLLTAYGDQTKMFEYIYHRLEGKFDHKVTELDDDQNFSGLVLQYIFNTQDPVIINDKIKQIYEQLPIRMTKSRFFNYVDDSFNLLKGIEQSQLTAYSQLIKDVIYPEAIQADGIFLPKIKEMLEDLNNGYDLVLKEEELIGLLQGLDQVGEHIDLATGYYLYVVNMVNELMGLLIAITSESKEIAQASVDSFVQLMEKLSYKKKGQPLIDDEINTLLVQTEGVIEGLSMELGQADALVETALITYQESIKKLQLVSRYQNMKIMPILSSGSYFADFEQENKMEDLVDEFYLAQTKKELTQWIEGVFNKETRVMQRARMANAFSVINVVHRKPQEVYQFILDALLACNDVGEKTMSKRLIRELMQDNDN